MSGPTQNIVDVDTALLLAQRLISWCDRVKTMHAFAPEARVTAQTSIDIDDHVFRVEISYLGPIDGKHDTIADSDGDDGA